MTSNEIEKCICGAEQSPCAYSRLYQRWCYHCGRKGPIENSPETAIEAWNRDMRGLRLLQELHGECGVEHDDPRLDYVTVQVPRVLWGEIRPTA
jgi:hypothetical protein